MFMRRQELLTTLTPDISSSPSLTEPYVAEGRHVLATFSGIAPELLDNEALLVELCQQAVAATGAHTLQVASHHFEPQGVTLLLLLSESHASLHTYPEEGVAFWDCFTCGWTCDPNKSIEVLTMALQPTDVRAECIVRQ